MRKKQGDMLPTWCVRKKKTTRVLSMWHISCWEIECIKKRMSGKTFNVNFSRAYNRSKRFIDGGKRRKKLYKKLPDRDIEFNHRSCVHTFSAANCAVVCVRLWCVYKNVWTEVQIFLLVTSQESYFTIWYLLFFIMLVFIFFFFFFWLLNEV